MKLSLLILCLLLFFISNSYGQDLFWTGNANDNNFFTELNWKNSATNTTPPDGTINFNNPIHLNLKIENYSQVIIANGILNLGTGSLTILKSTVKANNVSNGTLIIEEDGYLDLEDTNPLQNNVTIQLNSGIGWVRTKKLNGETINNNFINQIKVNQQTAIYRSNLRLDNYYLNGTVIRSNALQTAPLTIFDALNLKGNSTTLSVDIVHSGNSISNTMDNKTASFLLKKGFMVTLAAQEDGTGKSKNYIALEEDIIINELPKYLQNNISFIRIIPWNWVTKKGIGGNTNGLDNGWFYRWNNNGQSTISKEYGPMAWGAGGANDDGDIALYKSIYKATHVLAFNESDNCNDQSGQFSNLCTTDVAVGFYKNLMKTGLRLVSPSGRENAPFGWLKEFHKKATAQDIRIDVIGVHWYDWGSNPEANPNHSAQVIFNRFKQYLKDVYDLYKLPIWITEFNANPNRNNAINYAFMQLALPYLETLDYVERYAWFQPSSGTANYYSGNSLTNVGNFYKSQISTPAIFSNTYKANNNLDIYYQANSFLLIDNKVKNGDFETGNLTNWAGTNIDILTTDAVYAGTTSGRIKAGEGNIYQEVTVEPNKTYNLSFYAKWFVAPTNPVEVKILNTATGNVITSKMMNSSTVWNLVETPFTAPNGVTSIKISIEKQAGSPGWFVDNVLVEKSTTLKTANFSKNSFNVYPNPSSGIVNITSDNKINSYSIYNLKGQEIQKKFNVNSNLLKINLSQQAKGMYFIKLVTIDDSVTLKKIIKN